MIRPGYSGSPVLRAGTRRVVGVAVQQHLPDGASALACSVGLEPCRFVPPYYAVPVARVADLVDLDRWR